MEGLAAQIPEQGAKDCVTVRQRGEKSPPGPDRTYQGVCRFGLGIRGCSSPEPALARATGWSRLRNRVEVDDAASVEMAVGGKSEMISVFAPNTAAARLAFCARRWIMLNSVCSQAPS